MKYIENNNNNVYFNLAFEEYVFNNLKDDDYILLWKNDESIVLGKYQNAFEEINIKAVENNGIKVARRNTGGGTVFHDRGNLNYSFMINYDRGSFADYDKFIMPIIEALKTMGIDANKRRSSDIAINNMKISGSAQAISGGRILHHGTLLFNSDIEKLNEMLKALNGKFECKSVKSVRSIVTNISRHIDNKNMSINDFQEALLNALFPSGIEKVILTDKQLNDINELVEKKYSKWEWNYGRSPDFTYKKQSHISDGCINVQLSIKKGLIDGVNVTAEVLPCADIENALKGSFYSHKEITKKLMEIQYIDNINIEELVSCFF